MPCTAPTPRRADCPAFPSREGSPWGAGGASGARAGVRSRRRAPAHLPLLTGRRAARGETDGGAAAGKRALGDSRPAPAAGAQVPARSGAPPRPVLLYNAPVGLRARRGEAPPTGVTGWSRRPGPRPPARGAAPTTPALRRRPAAGSKPRVPSPRPAARAGETCVQAAAEPTRPTPGRTLPPGPNHAGQRPRPTRGRRPSPGGREATRSPAPPRPRAPPTPRAARPPRPPGARAPPRPPARPRSAQAQCRRGDSGRRAASLLANEKCRVQMSPERS